MSDVVVGGRFRLAPALATIVLTILVLWMVGTTATVFLLLLLAIIISLYLGAVRDVLVRRARIPDRLAFILAIAGTLLAIAGLFALLVPPVIEQTQELVTVLPAMITKWEAGLDGFVTRFPALRDTWKPGEHQVLLALYDQLSSTASTLVPKVFGAVEVIIELFAVIVMSIYMALHPGVYREWLIALFPPVHRDLVRDVLRDLADALRSYIVAQLLAMTILAAFTAIGLYLLDVPYALTFGIFTGAVAIVPFFGSLVSTVLPAFFVLGSEGGGGRAIAVLLLGVVVHVFEGNVVVPRVMSHKLELPPVLTIMAVLLAGTLLGPLGLILAVPILASTMVIIRRILINRIYEGRGFRKSTRDRTFTLRVPAADGGVLQPSVALVDVLQFSTPPNVVIPPPVVVKT